VVLRFKEMGKFDPNGTYPVRLGRSFLNGTGKLVTVRCNPALSPNPPPPPPPQKKTPPPPPPARGGGGGGGGGGGPRAPTLPMRTAPAS